MIPRTKSLAVLCLICLTASCLRVRRDDVMIALRDSVEDEADRMRQSNHISGQVAEEMIHLEPWCMIFVPANRYDEASAAAAGVPDAASREILNQLDRWKGSAVIAYVTPTRTVTTRLPDGVDVEEEIILKGAANKTEVVVSLSQQQNTILVSSVTSRSLP